MSTRNPAVSPLMTFVHEPNVPTADGISYSDTWGVPVRVLKLLGDRGLVFGTAFDWDGTPMCGDIIAGSLDAARDVAFGRGLGEAVTERFSNFRPDDLEPERWSADVETVEPESADARSSQAASWFPCAS